MCGAETLQYKILTVHERSGAETLRCMCRGNGRLQSSHWAMHWVVLRPNMLKLVSVVAICFPVYTRSGHVIYILYRGTSCRIVRCTELVIKSSPLLTLTCASQPFLRPLFLVGQHFSMICEFRKEKQLSLPDMIFVKRFTTAYFP